MTTTCARSFIIQRRQREGSGRACLGCFSRIDRVSQSLTNHTTQYHNNTKEEEEEEEEEGPAIQATTTTTLPFAWV